MFKHVTRIGASTYPSLYARQVYVPAFTRGGKNSAVTTDVQYGKRFEAYDNAYLCRAMAPIHTRPQKSGVFDGGIWPKQWISYASPVKENARDTPLEAVLGEGRSEDGGNVIRNRTVFRDEGQKNAPTPTQALPNTHASQNAHVVASDDALMLVEEEKETMLPAESAENCEHGALGFLEVEPARDAVYGLAIYTAMLPIAACDTGAESGMEDAYVPYIAAENALREEDAEMTTMETTDAPEILLECAKTKGFLAYKELWYREDVDLCLRGIIISGIPISLKQDTLRVVNKENSYIVPVDCIDYIRTDDGYGAKPS